MNYLCPVCYLYYVLNLIIYLCGVVVTWQRLWVLGCRRGGASRDDACLYSAQPGTLPVMDRIRCVKCGGFMGNIWCYGSGSVVSECCSTLRKIVWLVLVQRRLSCGKSPGPRWCPVVWNSVRLGCGRV